MYIAHGGEGRLTDPNLNPSGLPAAYHRPVWDLHVRNEFLTKKNAILLSATLALVSIDPRISMPDGDISKLHKVDTTYSPCPKVMVNQAPEYLSQVP